MANPEHLAVLKQGVEVWNQWRLQAPNVIPDLSGTVLMFSELGGVNFAETDLTDTVLAEANLHKAKLTGSTLVRATLHEANLNRANLSRANLDNADLSVAILTQTDLRGSKLVAASLWGAYCNSTRLDGTDFTGVLLSDTVFTDCDLSRAVGLELVEHAGPSRLDIATFLQSYGRVPDAFLRGVGIPESLMVYAKSLLAAQTPIRFYSCFISHSTKDQACVNRLQADLQDKGVRCWFAPHDIQGGKKIHEQLDEAIRIYDRLLLILSDASMTSEWVKTEVANARQREVREKRQMLFPISLVPFDRVKEWKAFDADTGKDSAREVREYFIPDFSNWKDHDSYQKAFERLLRDLKAEGSRHEVINPQT